MNQMINKIYRNIHRVGLFKRRRTVNFLESPELKADDIMLVSYPKSGNTWVRMIIAFLLYDSNRIKSLADLDHLVPDIYKGIPRNKHYSNPRVIKTHQPFGFRHELLQKNFYTKNIYIVRHPLDVIRSYFDFQYNLWGENRETSIDIFALKIVNGVIGGSWQENVLSWKAMEEDLEILFIRYEDLVANPITEIQIISGFLGKSITLVEAEEINQMSSLINMRKFEKKKSIVDEHYSFVRKGDKRHLRSDMSQKTKEIVCDMSKFGMNLFGYEMK